MTQDWQKRIVSAQQILRGMPYIKGTRIPVPLILGYLAAGKSSEEIILQFPDLNAEDIIACSEYSA